MSETMPQTIWHKMRYTPMRDFLRGKLTGRLDLRRPLEESGLPIPIKRVIHRTVAKTLLWRLERLEVTHELISHFADGLAAGISSEDLISKFGNERQAARLIRRAKRRNRPLPWHAARFAGWFMAALLSLYSGYALYFFAGKPSPHVDYVANINRAIEAAPVEDRAWPFYRRALLGMGNLGQLESQPQFYRSESPWLLQFVKDHQEQVEWIRKGAAKPEFGFLIGANGSAFDEELWPERKRPSVDPVSGENLIGVALPPIRTIRMLAGTLAADAVLARQAKDGKRLARDLHALPSFSRQMGSRAPLLWGLVSLAMYDTALDQIELTLNEDPTLITQDNWNSITEELSKPKVSSDLITFDSERLWFEDMLQRSFTDDGSGNGRFTPEGVRYFDGSLGLNAKRPWREFMVHPAVGLFVPSRQKLSSEYTEVLNRASANLKLPMREVDWTEIEHALESSRADKSPVSIALFAPSFWMAQARAEAHLGRRDGIIVGIALEAYRREHGSYPPQLQALVPAYLSEVPADRFTGKALGYRLADGKVSVYSVGTDRDDDGGRAPVKPYTASLWESQEQVPDGDWVVYSTR